MSPPPPSPVGAGHARPATLRRRPLLFCIVGRGLDPSAGRRGRRPLQSPVHHTVGEEFIPSAPLPVVLHLTIHSVGAAYMPPATSPPPAAHLPPPTNHCIPTKPFRPPPIICARQPLSPQYTPCPNFSLKLCRKNQKNLQKPVDKGHTTCYNNQAVSRAQPAAAAAGAFTYSLYTVF